MENLMGRYRNITILGAVVILQVLGLAIQIKRPSNKESESARLIRVWAVGIVTPLERGVVRVQSSANDVWHNYFYLRGVRQQNRELQEQLQQLQLEQVRLRQDAEQAHRLQALLGFKEQFIDKTIAAQVIATSGSEQSRTVYLDKGSEDGIAQDMAVISAAGIVGKVSQVFRHTSQVLLINDQTSGVGTILEQSRMQGVLKGRPNGEVVLDKVMSDEEVKTGDHVLTSGGDQIFPKGLPVGTVAKVTRGTEFQQVSVKPAAALNHLEEVLVITKKAEREPAVSSTGAPLRAADILAQRLPTVPDTPPAPVGSAAGTASKPAAAGAPGLVAKPATGSSVNAGSQTAAGVTKPQSNPSAPTPAQPGSSPQLAPRIAPGTQPPTGTGQTTIGNPIVPAKSAAKTTGTNTAATGSNPAASPKPQATSGTTGVPVRTQSTNSAIGQSHAPSLPKAAPAAPPKTVKPAASAPKPATNTTPAPAQSDSNEAPQ
jgi:rod shape-determining protein MreC